VCKGKRLLATCLLLFLLPVAPMRGQVSSATITGQVKDPSGRVIPKAEVSVREVATGVLTTALTNATGEYTLPLLKPGTYDVIVEVAGFNRFEEKALALSAGDHPTVDIPLTVGDVGQTVEVNATPPLLGTEDASVGQVVPTQLVENLPLSGRTPMSFAQYTVGVVATTNPVGVRPFDNSAVAGFSVGGLPNKNSEILMDGSPDNASDNAPAYELPIDATREVTIKVFESDATYGHSGGGVANQVSKSGTNRLHGTLSEFHQDSALNAYPYFSKRSPGFKPSVSRQNQFGGTVGGPVWIPKVLNGRDKLFFFFGYEGFYDSGTGGSYISVPTAAERAGDFSQVLSQGTTRTDTECKSGSTVVTSAPYNSQAIFDPASGTLDQACAALGFTVYDRKPFSNNDITTGTLPLNPVALAALKYFPQPNAPGNALGQNNYYQTAETGDRYNNEFGRVDYNLSSRQKLYVTMRHNQRVQYNNFLFGASNPALGDYLYRVNWGGSVGDVFTITPSLISEVRLNYTRYSQPSYTSGDGFNPTSLGLPNLPSAHLMFPRFFFNNGSVTNLGATTQAPGTAPFNSYDLFADVIKVAGLHSLKFGVDARKFQKGNFTFGNSAGLYNFNSDFTDAFGTDPYGGAAGSDTAAFLLGLPSSASYDLNSHAVGNQTYLGLFVQDDWRATPDLTLNFGLRYDKDFSPNEREGSAVSGFDFTDPNPYAAAANAAYAAHPNSTLPVSAFKVNGGLTFNSPGNTKFSSFPSQMFSPRFGLAYKPQILGNNTVIRGGFGIFVISIFPFNNSIQQEGFSQTTQAPILPYAPPTANGPGTLSNPFPNGLSQSTGSSLGLATFAGQAITFLDPNIRNGYSERWHLGVQHQLPGGWLADVFYEGSTGRRLPINESLNYVQRQYETTATNPGLSASVANPFYGLIPNGGSLNSGKTVNLTTLLQTYPEFGAITEYNVPEGMSTFHALDIHVDHRTGYGLSVIANYQWSKLLEAVSFLNLNDPKPEYRISQYDHPTHAVIAVSYELPYGRKRHFGGNAPRWIDLPLGGWNIASSWFYQQGAPLTFGDVLPTGQAINYSPRRATEYGGQPGTTYPSFNINAFNNNLSSSAANIPQQGEGSNPLYNFQPVNHIRTVPSQFANLRNDALNDWDASVLKNFNITEGSFLQFRLEAFNVNNRPVFSGPNLSPTSGAFGQITGTQNSNRVVQLGARIVF
jgi:Carboxypeptidase regulatory-like domain